MIVRPATAQDRPALDGMAADIWAGHDIMGHPGLHGVGSLVAIIDGAPVAAATAHRGKRDPSAVQVHVDVAGGNRRRGIATRLLDELTAAHPARLYVGRTLWSRPGAAEFARARDFKEAERALEGWIDPRLAEGWAHAVLGPAGPDVREMAAGEADGAALLLADTYRRTHPWNPPAPFTAGEARATFMGDADDGGVVVAVDGSRIVGAACLSRPALGPADGRAWLSWVGTEPDAAVAVTERLVARCVLLARDRGLLVRVEVNNHHASLWAAVAGVPGSRLEQDLVVWTRAG